MFISAPKSVWFRPIRSTSHADFGALYPAARMASVPELRGTRARIVVPRLGCDSTEKVPFRSFSRSSMLMRPSPRPSFAASLSKPAPESLTARWISSDVPHNRTSTCRTPLCFAELWRASWRTRKRQSEMFGAKGLGKSSVLKSISTCCCSSNSRQKPLMAASMPRYSNFDECNSCDKVWISVAISLDCFHSSPIRSVQSFATPGTAKPSKSFSARLPFSARPCRRE
jgi:hypothetical protein